MADVDLFVGGRNYTIACRDGGEEHLRSIATHVDRKAQEARAAVGDVNETRQLLFAALLLADELTETRKATQAATPAPASDSYTAQALATFATRIESIADALERRATNA